MPKQETNQSGAGVNRLENPTSNFEHEDLKDVKVCRKMLKHVNCEWF